jgi:hypothetical protein
MSEVDFGDSEFDYDHVVGLIRTTPPSCISGFIRRQTESPTTWTHAAALTAWQLSCRCGSTTGRFLGYPLSQFNSSYQGNDFGKL